MLSAKELIEEVEDGLESSCIERKSILRALNRGLFDIAAQADIYLPELLVRGRSLSSFVGRYHTTLPGDYHKKITSVMVSGNPVRVFSSVDNMELEFNGLTNIDGDICGVATQGNKIFYQHVPTEQQEMVIGYYRKPDQLIDSDSSFPEGASGSDSFNECIISHALWKLYKKIENGIEGPMSNMAYYKNEFYENLETLKDFCTRDSGPGNTEPGSEPMQLFNY